MSTTDMMRDYLVGQIPMAASIFAGRSTKELATLIDGVYEGGIKQWREDYIGHRVAGPETELELRSRIVNDHGFRLQQCDRVISFKQLPDGSGWDLYLETYTEEESFSRLRLTERRLRVFRLTSNYCSRSGATVLVDVIDTDFVGTDYVGQYAVLNTPERFASKMLAYLECARPGSSRSPMDAPMGPSRENSDWEDYFKIRSLCPELNLDQE